MPHADQPSASYSAVTPERDPTWQILLAKWIEFAKASVALPDDHAESAAWRAAVPHVIALQAVTCALGDAHMLPPAERAVGRDRAAVTIRDAARGLADAWGASPMPDQLLELMQDARDAIRVLETLAVHWVVDSDRWEAAGLEAAARALAEAGFTGDALAAPDGTTLFRNAVAAAVFPEPDPTHPAAAAFDRFDRSGLRRVPGVAPARQVYRQTDDAGAIKRDRIAPFATELPAGMPLLAPLITTGSFHEPARRPAPLPHDIMLDVIDATDEPPAHDH